jgi:4-amino-4-deoxychorismate lyase
MILVDGAPGETIGVTDRGLTYGDGVFRTLAVRHARPESWSRQYRKLEHDCAALAIPCPGEETVLAEIARIAEREPDCAVKVIVTRGIGERGYALPVSTRPARIVMSFPLPKYPADYAESGVRVHLCRLRLGFQAALAGIKHLNRLENVMARAEWRDTGIAEGALLDGEGNVIGGTMTNLFIFENGALITPDLSRCGVAGVTRDRVIQAAAGHGLACRIERIGLDRLRGASEALLVNSLIGAWQIRKLADHTWDRGKLAADVRHWLDEDDD